MAEIWVKPNKNEIEHNLIAVWDQDSAHEAVDPKWGIGAGGPGGAFIAGDKANPDKIYKVADTPGIALALQGNPPRLVKAEAPVAPVVEVVPVVEAPVAPVIPPVEVPAPVEPPFTPPADADQTLPLPPKGKGK